MLDILRLPWPFSSRAVRSTLLELLRIEYDPPREPTDLYPGGAKSLCTISIDFDHITKSPNSTDEHWFPLAREDRLTQNRIGTRALIDLCERYDIPMMWAIAGSTAEADFVSYESILKSSIHHEVGVHTYAHIDVSSSSEEELLSDLQKCLAILNLKMKPTTFVFPWNRMGNFDLLEEMGFKAFRSQRRAIRTPLKKDRMWDFSPVYYVDTNSISSAKLICKYIDLCVSSHSVFHLWSHPWSIVQGDSARAMSENLLAPVFQHIKELRDSGKLSVLTMGAIAGFLESRN